MATPSISGLSGFMQGIERQVYAAALQNGCTPFAAAGIVGNSIWEMGPSAPAMTAAGVLGFTPTGGAGFWPSGAPGVEAQIQKALFSYSSNVSGPDKASSVQVPPPFPNGTLNQSATAEDAAMWWVSHFERSGDANWTTGAILVPSAIAGRKSYAQQAYAAYSGNITSNGSPGSSTSNSSKQSASFSVNSVGMPNGDYWTAANNFAQSAAWYLFSDGDFLYIADGQEIMNQTPAAVLSFPWNDSRVLRMDGTYDNSAFQFVSNGKPKNRVKQRSKLAKNTSPVQISVDYICDIDAIRGGDVIMIAGTGLYDGPWLVGDCTRSIFSIFSTLTLVPPQQPLNATTGGTKASVPGGGEKGTVGAVITMAKFLSSKQLVRNTSNVTQKYPDYNHDGYDCAGGVAYILYNAGFDISAIGGGLGKYGPRSNYWETWGVPGRGKEMTIWANYNHIFIEFHVPGIGSGHQGWDSGHSWVASAPWYADTFYDGDYVTNGQNGVPFTPRHWPGT